MPSVISTTDLHENLDGSGGNASAGGTARQPSNLLGTGEAGVTGDGPGSATHAAAPRIVAIADGTSEASAAVGAGACGERESGAPAAKKARK